MVNRLIRGQKTNVVSFFQRGIPGGKFVVHGEPNDLGRKAEPVASLQLSIELTRSLGGGLHHLLPFSSPLAERGKLPDRNRKRGIRHRD